MLEELFLTKQVHQSLKDSAVAKLFWFAFKLIVIVIYWKLISYTKHRHWLCYFFFEKHRLQHPRKYTVFKYVDIDL